MKNESLIYREIEKAKTIINEIIKEVEKCIVGRRYIIKRMIIALLSKGHILLEGNPGNAKTLLANTFAQTLDLDYKRIQFTPDLLPSDITGAYIYRQNKEEFDFFKGPIFANFLLADEINRASPKTQSALLEAMQENQVTIEGNSFQINLPYFVLATQNPLDSQGVFVLPEAQIDRFLMKLIVEYPTGQEELEILEKKTNINISPTKIIGIEKIAWLQKLTDNVFVSEEVKKYIVNLAQEIRNRKEVLAGPSPRSTFSLMRTGQARAILKGRNFVIPDDIYDLSKDVLAHRIIIESEAELNGESSQSIIDNILKNTSFLNNYV